MTKKPILQCKHIYECDQFTDKQCEWFKQTLRYKYAKELYNFIKQKRSYKRVLTYKPVISSYYNAITLVTITDNTDLPEEVLLVKKRSKYMGFLREISVMTKIETLIAYPELDIGMWDKNYDDTTLNNKKVELLEIISSSNPRQYCTY